MLCILQIYLKNNKKSPPIKNCCYTVVTREIGIIMAATNFFLSVYVINNMNIMMQDILTFNRPS